MRARAAPWRERGGSEREEMVDSTLKKGMFLGDEGEQAKRASQGEVEENMSG